MTKYYLLPINIPIEIEFCFKELNKYNVYTTRYQSVITTNDRPILVEKSFLKKYGDLYTGPTTGSVVNYSLKKKESIIFDETGDIEYEIDIIGIHTNIKNWIAIP